MNRKLTSPLLLTIVMVGLSCEDQGSMNNRGRLKPHEPTSFFADTNSSRPLVEGTVHRDLAFQTPPGNDFPFPITRKDLLRGQERYNIYCAVCHGQVGEGDGMIVQRGFTNPPSFHIDRLRDAPPGYAVQVMTNGFGAMYSYSDRVNLEDRWRISAYIRALQFSQRADPKQLPPEDQQKISAASAATLPTTRNTQ
jgi:mono/diheme cytochrome c family protein